MEAEKAARVSDLHEERNSTNKIEIWNKNFEDYSLSDLIRRKFNGEELFGLGVFKKSFGNDILKVLGLPNSGVNEYKTCMQSTAQRDEA